MMKTIFPFVRKYILWAFCLLCSCTKNSLESALEKSGENRKELEKVLAYYHQFPADSLKYRAARFLIENMPGHVTFSVPECDSICNNIRAYWAVSFRAELAMLNNPQLCSDMNIKEIEDIQVLTADFLIAHIEEVFRQREKYKWLKNISFDDFCEYLLPYRIDKEKPFLWRDSIVDGMEGLDKYMLFDNTRTSANYMSKYVLSLLHIPWSKVCKVLPSSFVAYSPDCRDIAYSDMIRYRLVGIPAAIDEIPCWGNCNGSHMWAQPIDYRERITRTIVGFNRIIPKIYRNTYSRHQVADAGKEYVPDLFQNPFLIDVTSEYLYSISKVEEKGFGNSRYGYLCVSDGRNWIPVAQAENCLGKCVFTNMGYDVVYLPIFYDGPNVVCANEPFLLKRNGEKKYFRASNQRGNLTVRRKYPIENIHADLLRFFTGIMEASHFEDFHESDTICHISNARGIMSPIQVKLGFKEYRYFRISSIRNPMYITELSFFNRTGKRIHAMSLQEIPNDSLMQDGNVLTSSSFSNPIIFSVPQGEDIAEIHILPRNDGNGIYPGDEYELYYFDKEQKWISCCKKVAKGYCLHFNQIPEGALFLLRNRTRGNQERIFSCEYGEQWFW